MKARIAAATALGLLGFGAALTGAAQAFWDNTPTVAAGTVDDFRLVDNTGFARELRRLTDVRAIVLVMQVNGDAGSRAAAKSLEALKAKHPDVAFMMLNSSTSDGRVEIAAEAAAQGWTVPVLDDDTQLVGEQLNATYAGEAWLIQPKTLKVLYHGPVSKAGAKGKAGGYLAEALADVTAGRAVKTAMAQGKGAAIAFPQRGQLDAHKAISYAKDIAPMLEAKCVSCHQSGGIAPFAMNNYQAVKGWAPMIRESVRMKRMPPWHPDPTVGEFVHDMGLTRDEVTKLVHWVEAGAPRGEGADPLAAVDRSAPEWPLGKPDMVIDIPAYTVPADGVVQYQYPSMKLDNGEARWVKAATLMPGDRQAVHHILAGFVSKEPPPGPAAQGQWEANYGEYAVGGESFMVPDKLGIELPANGYMSFQMHYTPYGKTATDTSKMGLYFYPKGETPEKIMRHYVLRDGFIELPPGEAEHKEIAYMKFPKEAILYSAFLHTHYRGVAGKLELITADGKRETLINLPRYDFNWQRTYEFAKPVTAPAGSKLVATYVYDNSVRNPSNPDPKATVYWGEQSWEEMHYTSIYYQWTDETVAKPADASKEMAATRLLGTLDDNLDEVVTKDELHGRVGKLLLAGYDKLDANKNGSLDAAELRAAQMQLAGLVQGSPPVPPPPPRVSGGQ